MKRQGLQRAYSLLNDNKQQTQQKNEPGEIGYFYVPVKNSELDRMYRQGGMGYAVSKQMLFEKEGSTTSPIGKNELSLKKNGSTSKIS